jgi:CHAT domain-containing protein
MKIVFHLLLLLLAGFIGSLPQAVLAQSTGDGMRVDRDANGTLKNAMYFKDGEPLYYWIQKKKITRFDGDWPIEKTLAYLNTELEVSLDISLESSLCLERIGDYFLETHKDFKTTEKFYLATTHMLEKLGNIPRSGYMYFFLGNLYLHWNKPKDAEIWYRKSVDVYKDLPASLAGSYAFILKAIYSSYEQAGKKAEAVYYIEKYLELGILDSNNPDERMGLLIYLGDGYWDTGRKQEALNVYMESLPLIEAKLGNTTKENQEIVFTLADRLYEDDFKKEAILLHLSLIELEPLQLNDKVVMDIYNSLIEYYLEKLDFRMMAHVADKMVPFISKYKEINKEFYVEMLDAFSILYQYDGKYDLAEKYMLECIQLKKELYSETDARVGSSLMNLGMIYMQMYNPVQALDLAEQGMNILKKGGNIQESAIRKYLDIQGMSQMNSLNYKEAETTYKQILQKSPRGGIAEIAFAVSLGTLATIYWYQEEYPLAASTYIEAIEIAEKSGLTQLRQFANFMGNLSLVYAKTGDFDEALKWNTSAIAKYREQQYELHPDFLSQKLNRSMYLEGSGSIAESVSEAIESNEAVVSMVDQNLLYWSENEMEAYINIHITRFFDYFHSNYLRNSVINPQLAGKAYNNQLFLKGLLLNSTRKFQHAVSGANDTILSALTEQQRNIRAELEKLYTLPADQRISKPEKLELEFSGLQKQIKQRISLLAKEGSLSSNLMMNEEIPFTRVRDALIHGQAAIEFLSFKYIDKCVETDSVYYCALILRKEFLWPEMVFLTTGNKLEELLKNHPDEIYSLENSGLYDEIWKPLEKYLEGIETVFYSPSGLLNRIAFSAIPNQNGQVLSQQYKLTNLASTRNLLTGNVSIQGNSGTIYGGIDYNADTLTLKRLARSYSIDQQDPALKNEVKRNLRGTAWDYLPGTKSEAREISRIMSDENMLLNTLIEQEATEESLKVMNGNSSSVIHIASHGFSFPAADQRDAQKNFLAGPNNQAYTNTENPLMRSGLLFAGANNTWAKGESTEGAEDGILTAYEMANLDLSGTSLMVLSACETGLGDIKGTEGVFGLQRSMFMAGVSSAIVSLWEVPDFETMELMTLFYKNLMRVKNPETAFQQAQKEMRTRYINQPSLWAGFVFIR